MPRNDGPRRSTLAVFMMIVAMVAIDLGFLVSVLKEPDYAHPAMFGQVAVGVLSDIGRHSWPRRFKSG